MSQKRIPILKVRWEDICSQTSWGSQQFHQERTTALCESVGYQLTRNATQVQLAQSISHTTNWADVISIPRRNVISIETIGYSTQPQKQERQEG